MIPSIPRPCPLFALAAALLGCAQPSPTSTPGPVTAPATSPASAATSPASAATSSASAATPPASAATSPASAATPPASAPPAGAPAAASAAASSPAPAPPAQLAADVDFFVTTLAVIGLQAPCPCPDAVAFHRVGQKLLVQAEQMYFEISPGGEHLQRASETTRPVPDQAGASRPHEAPKNLVSPQSAVATDGTLWLLRDEPASNAASPRTPTTQLLRRSPSGEWAQVRLHYPSGPLGDDVILTDLLVDGSSVWVIGYSRAKPKEVTVWTLRPA